MSDPSEPPFAKHTRYYLFLKIGVVIIAGLFAARYLWSAISSNM